MLKGRRGSKAVTPSQGVPRGGGGGGSSGSGGGGGQAFDPRLIFTQIAALQSFHYAFLSLFLQFSSVLFGRRPATLDAVFASGGLELWSSDAASVLAAGAAGAFLLAVIVEKSKKCLDFAATLFLLHLLACTLYPGGGGTDQSGLVGRQPGRDAGHGGPGGVPLQPEGDERNSPPAPAEPVGSGREDEG